MMPNRPIPIVFLSTSLSMGGAETQLVRLVINLNRTLWSPTVVSMVPPGEYEQVLLRANVPVLSLGMTKGRPSVAALQKMIRLLRQLSPQVLVCFMFHANLLGRIAGAVTRVPVIVSSVRSENFGARWREWALRLTDGLGDVTVTNSETVASSLVRRGVVPVERVHVIPNALPPGSGDPSQMHRAVFREQLGLSPGDFVWLAVGRIEEAKDYPNLLNAFSSVVRHHPQTKLLIAGSGTLLSQLQERSSSLGLEGPHVRFLGKRDDVATLLQVADGYVLSSAWEGVPNGLLEAMAVGLPCVCTSVGGTTELVNNGLNGFIVPPRRSDKLAEAMRCVMELTEESRFNIGRAAMDFVRSHYETNRVVGKWEQLFLEYLSTGAGSSTRKEDTH